MSVQIIIGLPRIFYRERYVFNGAYWVAYRHTRRAIELEPENDRNKESLLSFYDISDEILSMEEVLKIAKEVLGENPDSIFALRKYKKFRR